MQECEAGSHPLRVLLMFSFLCIWLRSQVSDETAVPVYAARSVSFLPLLHQSMCPWGSTPVSFFHRGLQNLSSLFHTLRASWCAVHWVYPFPPPTNPPTHGTDASKLPTLQSVVKKGGDKYFRQDAFLHVGVSVLPFILQLSISILISRLVLPFTHVWTICHGTQLATFVCVSCHGLWRELDLAKSKRI